MSELAVKFTLKIAEFIIKVVSKSESPVCLESSYSEFLVENEKFPLCDLLINVEFSIPDALKSNNELIFNAQYNRQNFWSIHQYGDLYRIIVYNQAYPEQVQQIAIVDKSFKEWTIYMDPTPGENNEVGHWPLLYPMGPLVMYYLTVSNDAIMIHASGVFDGQKGRIFSGFSGVGKSTMAKIWKNDGSIVINDDRLILRRIGGKYFIYNTPMHYSDNAKSCSLNAIYLINHAPVNSIKKLSGVKAISGILTNCIQQSYNRKFLENHLNFLTELINEIPVYAIGVVPDNNIIDFIKKNEN